MVVKVNKELLNYMQKCFCNNFCQHFKNINYECIILNIIIKYIHDY